MAIVAIVLVVMTSGCCTSGLWKQYRSAAHATQSLPVIGLWEINGASWALEIGERPVGAQDSRSSWVLAVTPHEVDSILAVALDHGALGLKKLSLEVSGDLDTLTDYTPAVIYYDGRIDEEADDSLPQEVCDQLGVGKGRSSWEKEETAMVIRLLHPHEEWQRISLPGRLHQVRLRTQKPVSHRVWPFAWRAAVTPIAVAADVVLVSTLLFLIVYLR